MKKTIFVFVLLFFVAFSVSAQRVVGVWKTIDDETGKAKSHVKLYVKNGKIYGKIVRLLESGKGPQTVCKECPSSGKFKSKGDKLVGLHIVKGLERDDDEWEEWYSDDGILDPNNGKVYDCKIWLEKGEQDKLYVRGYIGWLYRTQNWYRVK